MAEPSVAERPLAEAISRARKKFLAMAATYALGVFNDNFFKQAAMLLALDAGRVGLQGWATTIFTLPFLLFAAPAGWLADRFRKRHVIVGAKLLELVAMIAGAVGLLRMDWTLVFFMLFIMAAQSAVFSPALNGSIPELYPPAFVTTANARLRVVSTAAILAGIAAAGFFLDGGPALKESPLSSTGRDGTLVGETLGSAAISPGEGGPTRPDRAPAPSDGGTRSDGGTPQSGGGTPQSDGGTTPASSRRGVATGVVLVALVGLLLSFGVPSFPAAAPNAPFPRSGPLETLSCFWAQRRDELLFLCLLGECFFWFVASLQVQLVNFLGAGTLGLGKAGTSALVVAQLVGVAVGGVLAAHVSKGRGWHRVLVPSLGVMAVGMFCLAALPLLPSSGGPAFAGTFLALVGLAGGLFVVPVESFIQIRPDGASKGRIWSVANFGAFAGVMVSGPAFVGLHEAGVAPASGFGIAACCTVLAAWLLRRRLSLLSPTGGLRPGSGDPAQERVS